MKTAALVLVDIQNDFLPGGALAVPEGDRIIEPLSRVIASFELVVATRDWHPADHVSFAAGHPGRRPGDTVSTPAGPQRLWPIHCVQGTRGAELAAGLDRSRIARVFSKGVDSGIDSYSGFFDNARRRSTGLAEWLGAEGVERVFVAGLATDWCVKATALDAVDLGFAATLLEDACRGVDLEPGDVGRALEELRRSGVRLASCSSLGEEEAVRGVTEAARKSPLFEKE